MISSETRPVEHDRDWFFFDENDPILESDLSLIRPLTDSGSRAMWNEYVSRDPKQRHPMLLSPDHWLAAGGPLGPDWRPSHAEPVEGSDPVVDFFDQHVHWQPETLLLFFWMRERAVIVPWGVFRRTWRSFLLGGDEGPFLLDPSGAEVAWFGPNGNLGVCSRPFTSRARR